MNDLVRFLALVAPATAVVAAVGATLGRRLLSGPRAAASAAGVAGAMAYLPGYALGYALLSDWAPLVPKYHWHRTPYVAVAVGLAALLAVWTPPKARFAVWLSVGIAAGVVLTPTWPPLEDSRAYSIVAFAIATTLLMLLTEPLAERPAGKHLAWILAGSTILVAGSLIFFLSFKYGLMALLAFAGFVGAAMGSGAWRDARVAVGLIPLYSYLVVGLAWIGYFDLSQFQPAQGMLLLPFAPLALWSCVSGPLSRRTGPTAVAARAGVVILAASVGLALLFVGHH